MFPAFILIFLATLLRVLSPALHLQHSWNANFSPLASIVLCGAVFFPRKWALLIPISILLLSDFALNTFVYSAPLFSWDILSRYVVFFAIGTSAFHWRNPIRKSFGRIALATLASSLTFFLLTNAASWLSDPGYLKSPAGFFQAMTIGLPGYPPTWMFFRNSLISDLVFTGLFLVCMAVGDEKTQPADDAGCVRAI